MNRIEERTRGILSAGLSASEARRKRDETNVKLRKARRDEQIWKKRNMTHDFDEADDVTVPDVSVGSKDLLGLVDGVMSQNTAFQVEATAQFRKLLSIERNPPISQVVEAGVVPKFVEFLDRFDAPLLQFEAAWALTNIASGTSDDTKIVIRFGAVPKFVKLLSSPNNDVREQAIWALGNIAGDSPEYRDLVLGHGILLPLLQLLSESTKISMLRNATWTLSNLCRGKPQPDFDSVRQALPTLARLVYSNDEEVLTDACWAMSYLSDGEDERIQAILDSGVTSRIVELLIHQATSVQTPALRTIGNIVTGNDSQTQAIINASVLPCLFALLSHSKRSIRKEACWTISNITAGSKDQIQAVIQAGVFPPLINLLSNAEFEIRKEAAWALSNATSGGSPAQIQYFVQCGCIRPLCDLLVAQEVRILNVALEGIENILRAGEETRLQNNLETNPYTEYLEAAEGLDRIEALQNHTNKDIREHAQSIVEVWNRRDLE
eukprot:c13105_g1_i2.p1 GENE.c13105_g1_i2~~c13105_g1_i2.p1  ORF type:complete len:553 (-),score=155.79 c13105_g1_i2:974-2452(-)